MALTTLARLKAHLGITTNTDDVKLENILEGSSAFVEQWFNNVGRAIAKVVGQTDLIDGRDSPRIFTRFRPIITVTSVHEDQNQDFIPASLLDPDTFRVYKEIGMIKLAHINPRREFFHGPHAFFFWGTQNIQVIYDAGFEVVPQDIQQAIVMIAAAFRGQAGREDKKSERLGDYGYTLAEIEKMPAVQGLLANYLTPVVTGFGV